MYIFAVTLMCVYIFSKVFLVRSESGNHLYIYLILYLRLLLRVEKWKKKKMEKRKIIEKHINRFTHSTLNSLEYKK